MIDKVLLKARNAHSTRTGHKRIFVGANFVECFECRKHAHLTSDGKRLYVHDGSYKNTETIDAEDF